MNAAHIMMSSHSVRAFQLEPAQLQLARRMFLGAWGDLAWSVDVSDPPVSEPPVTRDLAEARHDLLRSEQEAHNLGYPQPTRSAFNHAAHLLTIMYRMAPRRFEVYPTPDGEIAIDTSPTPGRSLVVLCDSNGEVFHLLYVDGHQESQRHRSPSELSHEVLRNLLSRLGDASA